jgi:hyperosmotically inducible protein
MSREEVEKPMTHRSIATAALAATFIAGLVVSHAVAQPKPEDDPLKAQSMKDRAAIGAYVDDSIITAKVKAALLKAQELKSLSVSVETYKGQVLLSGFIDNESQRQSAMKAASGVEGVIAVKDGMVVR